MLCGGACPSNQGDVGSCFGGARRTCLLRFFGSVNHSSDVARQIRSGVQWCIFAIESIYIYIVIGLYVCTQVPSPLQLLMATHLLLLAVFSTTSLERQLSWLPSS